MAAGLGFKTFTTGEVLTAADTNGYLMQGVLVFASAAARDAAITSPQEGQFAYLKDTNVTTYYTGSAWANLDTTGMTNPMTTTGDMVYSSSGSTPARLGIGTTGQVLSVAGGIPSWATASSGSSNVAGKNNILNSAFNVAQRGTSFTIAASTATYTLDRWQAYRTATGMTVTQQNTSDTTNLPFIQKCVRLARDNATTSTVAIQYVQTIETVNSIPYAGKAITLSFYARAGANYSPTSSALLVYLQTGTGTDQNYINGFTGASNIVNGSTATLTTTWQRFTFNATVGATATQLAVALNMNPTGTAGAADYCEVTGFQLEIAASATAYSPNAATYALEEAACQRYYFQFMSSGGDQYKYIGFGFNLTGSLAKTGITFPVTMRTAPSLISASGTDFYNFQFGNGSGGATNDYFNSFSINQQTTTGTAMQNSTEISGTINVPGTIFTASTSASIGFSAEL